MHEPQTEPAFLFEDRQTPGDWHVQWTNGDGGFEMAIFSGPRAREPGDHVCGTMLWRLRRSPHRRGCVGHTDVAARGLYKATDGSWRQADAKKGIPLLYRLKEGERWTLLDGERFIVVHPNRPAKIITT